MPDHQTADNASDFYFLAREEPEEIRDLLLELVARRIPNKFGADAIRDVQVLCPMNRGSIGTRELNEQLQQALNPLWAGEIEVERFGYRFPSAGQGHPNGE